jgi:hypothetical protein
MMQRMMLLFHFVDDIFIVATFSCIASDDDDLAP